MESGKTMGNLPDFIIIGEMKCGTTALYKYLTEHAQVQPAKRKEINFFNTYYDRGLAWYQSQFPDCVKCITGESSGYLRFPEAASKIYKAVPQVKLILILRNPVDRAYSHYHMRLDKGEITSPFEQAIQSKSTYLEIGNYVWNLKRWMEVFPKDQFHIVQSEKLFKQPQKTLDETFRFLGLSPHPLDVYKHHNSGSYSKMNPETRRRLIQYYKPNNDKLYQFLGTKFDWD